MPCLPSVLHSPFPLYPHEGSLSFSLSHLYSRNPVPPDSVLSHPTPLQALSVTLQKLSISPGNTLLATPFSSSPHHPHRYLVFSPSSRGLGYFPVLPWWELGSPTFAFFPHYHTCDFPPGNVSNLYLAAFPSFLLVALSFLVIQQVSPLQRTSVCSGNWVKAYYSGNFNLRVSIKQTVYPHKITELGENRKPVRTTAIPLSFPLTSHHSVIH